MAAEHGSLLGEGMRALLNRWAAVRLVKRPQRAVWTPATA